MLNSLRRIIGRRTIRSEDEAFRQFFKTTLGFTPRNLELYHIAFVHRSKSINMGQGHRVNNERLEYLGDSVLSTVIADMLYRRYPTQGEGFLTEMRSKLVSRKMLNKLAREMGLPQLIQSEKQKQTGAFKSIDGNTFEALIGAIYLEKGFEQTRRIIVEKIYNVYMNVDDVLHTDWNYKGRLIDWGQKNRHKISFEVENITYHGHEGRKRYDVRVKIDGEPAEHAAEFSIKAADQLAAEMTYKKLQEQGLIPPSLGETKQS